MQCSSGILTRQDGATIAYRRSVGIKPGVVFLHGLRSDMNGTKALALERACQAEGRSFLCFDLRGHGGSSGDFAEFGISDWRDDVVEALDRLTEGPQILVGSSLGGWLMLLAALRRPQRIVGLLGLAAAPDFTDSLMMGALNPDQRRRLELDGQVMIADCYGGAPYAISRTLIAQGADNLLLKGAIPILCPVILIQGQRDADVPWQTALTLAERLSSAHVEVALVKQAGHRLSEPGELELILSSLTRLLSAAAHVDCLETTQD